MDQFCRFTVGFKYQYANAQVVKKFIKRPIVRHKRDFQRAYERVRVRTKGCYIATYAFGDAHPATRELRDFRDSFLIRTRAGIFFLRAYETYSPKVVSFFKTYPRVGFFMGVFFLRPIIFVLFRIIKFLRHP